MTAKPKPTKRKKKSSRQLYEIELDRLVRTIVLLRDGNCVCPAPKGGHSMVLQPGHLISRSKESVKWDLRNIACQCSGCNLRHEFAPERYTDWFIKSYSAEEYARLVEDSALLNKLTIDDLIELRTQLIEIHERQLVDKDFKPRFTQKEIMTGEWKTKVAYTLSDFYMVTGTVSRPEILGTVR